MLENLNPTLHAPTKPRLNKPSVNLNDFNWDGEREPINAAEIFDHIRDIQDPEHPHSLEVLGVLNDEWIHVNDEESWVCVEYSPTIPGCSMATLIGLAIKVKLIRSLPRRFKIEVKVKPGTHDTEDDINKQLADKERVAAALENPALVKLVNNCLTVPSD
uniref:MIP18 family-like domain-containing protein n=1 Tax=Trichobilharzia regenti TaxID=157069 RepID=A0AA85J0I9_TRIRE|nr:unnamed protein product [Trichobilharzia regenti]